MRTFGIDLASQPDNTAVCMIEWRADQAEVVEMARGFDRYGDALNDKRLMHVMTGDLYGQAPAMTAIDAPLGWPILFSRVIADQTQWPDSMEGNPAELLRRTTDLFVAKITGKRPLAVTTERIAYAALRANRILGRLQRSVDLPIDRSGMTGVVCETYPDAALRRFGLWPEGLANEASYKDKEDPAVRRLIVQDLLARAPWLALQDDDAEQLRASDDCLDALLCALVARARVTRRTLPPVEAPHAAIEGWIHLPENEEVLEALIQDGQD